MGHYLIAWKEHLGKKGSILLPLVAFFTTRQGEITYLNILKCSSVSCLFKTLQKVLINACNDSYRLNSLNYKIQICGRAKSGKNEHMNSFTQAKERTASFDWCIYVCVSVCVLTVCVCLFACLGGTSSVNAV